MAEHTSRNPITRFAIWVASRERVTGSLVPPQLLVAKKSERRHEPRQSSHPCGLWRREVLLEMRSNPDVARMEGRSTTFHQLLAFLALTV
jgi:hypothetical protein